MEAMEAMEAMAAMEAFVPSAGLRPRAKGTGDHRAEL
jgi:hypothetical protein